MSWYQKRKLSTTEDAEATEFLRKNQLRDLRALRGGQF